MEPIQVRLTNKLKKRIDEEVSKGMYPTRSEAIRSAIRNLTETRGEANE